MTITKQDNFSTRDKILDSAEFLIKQFGYNGFSYEDISKSVGIKKPSIHHYFPAKSDVGVAVIKRYVQQFEKHLNFIETKSSSTIICLKDYIHLFIEAYGNDNRLCLCGMLAAELGSLSAEMRKELQTFFHINLAWLSNIFLQGKNSNQFSLSGEPNDEAFFLLSTLEGAMIVGRSLNSAQSLKKVGDCLVRMYS